MIQIDLTTGFIVTIVFALTCITIVTLVSSKTTSTHVTNKVVEEIFILIHSMMPRVQNTIENHYVNGERAVIIKGDVGQDVITGDNNTMNKQRG